MADLSPDIDTAMFALLALCPHTMDDIGPRCVESVWIGEREVSGEKERMAGRAQTCTMASGDPERKKLEVGSTAMDVTGWRWEVDVETRRPEQIYETLELILDGIYRCWATTDLPCQNSPTLCA
jgi:hypothetical protein